MTTEPKSLDHIAVWVEDPPSAAGELCDQLGIHVIESSEDFVLVGADSRQGKITLFRAQEPPEAALLQRIVLRVKDLDAARSRLAPNLEVPPSADGEIHFEGPQGLGLGLCERDGLDYDLDHLVLAVPEPGPTASRLEKHGFEVTGDGAVRIRDRYMKLVRGVPHGERSNFNHIALLVDSVDDSLDEIGAEESSIEKRVDTDNTYAAFVSGPAGITIEYIEHKPSFSLV